MILKFKYPVIIAVILLLMSFSALSFFNFGKITLGTMISGQNIGGLSMGEAVKHLTQKVEEYKKREITIAIGMPDQKSHEIKTTASEIGIKFDIEKTVSDAYNLSRKEKFPANIIGLLRISIFGKKMELTISIDQQKFESFFQKKLKQYENPAKNAEISYNAAKNQFGVTPQKKGKVINQIELRRRLLENGAALVEKNILASFQDDNPQVTLAQAESAAQKANQILNAAPFLLRYNSQAEYKLEKSQLKDMMIFVAKDGLFSPDINDKGIEEFLMQIAPTINVKPQNAVLTMKHEKIAEFAISKEGRELDIQKSAGEIKSNILEKNQKEIMLAVTTILPEIRTDTIENLGLTALLGTGESDFKGSPASRAHNISLAAKKMNGILIKPGDEFSFVNAIGEIGPKEGYQAGLVIKGNKTVPEYGGGVCQVSTTMFRAAINAGLKITERYAHSLLVQYYNPQGFDATIYGPHPDLRFINDTGFNILVQTKIKGTKLYFEFYGTPDGREVKVIGPVEYDKKPDGSLKATLTREIYRNGELASKDVFRSSYRSPQKEPSQRNPLE